MSYRRVQEPKQTIRKMQPLSAALVVLGVTLLVASGFQLVQILDALPPPAQAARGALTAVRSAPPIAASSILGAVALPLAAVASFVAFGFARARQMA